MSQSITPLEGRLRWIYYKHYTPDTLINKVMLNKLIKEIKENHKDTQRIWKKMGKEENWKQEQMGQI
jgi:hypothetical protein